MMKNTALRLLFAILTLSLLPVAALAGVGVHFGWDMNSQDSYDLIREEFAPDEWVAISAEKIDKSLLAGIHFSFGMLPLVDLEFGFEGSFTQYRLLYENFPTEFTDISDYDIDEDVPFARVGFYATGKYNVIKMPTVKGYVGAGLNYNIVTPMLTKTFVETETADGDYDLDADDIIEILGDQAGVGMHLAFGVRGKPAALPIAIYGEGRLYFLPENDYGDETNQFFTIVFGLDIGF